LLYLVGCLHRCTSDGRSHKHQILMSLVKTFLAQWRHHCVNKDTFRAQIQASHMTRSFGMILNLNLRRWQYLTAHNVGWFADWQVLMQMDAAYSGWNPGSCLTNLRNTTQYSIHDRQSYTGIMIKCRPLWPVARSQGKNKDFYRFKPNYSRPDGMQTWHWPTTCVTERLSQPAGDIADCA